MKRAKRSHKYRDMEPEYDFSSGVRGKYAREFSRGSNVVVLDPDVAEVFRDSLSVNATLRTLVSLARVRSRKSRR